MSLSLTYQAPTLRYAMPMSAITITPDPSLPPAFRVFVAEDSALVRQRLATMVSGLQGVELVGQSGDARATIAAVLSLKPDALLLDLHMPGGTGFRVLEVLRGDLANLTIIVCTAFAYPQYRRKCLAAGARYFLDKATELGLLPGVIEELRDAAASTRA